MKVLQGVKQIMQLFVDQGYALNGSIEEIASGKSDELMFRVWTSFSAIWCFVFVKKVVKASSWKTSSELQNVAGGM